MAARSASEVSAGGYDGGRAMRSVPSHPFGHQAHCGLRIGRLEQAIITANKLI